MAEPQTRADITNLLSNVLQANPAWVQLAEAIRDLFYTQVEAPIDQLATIRAMRQTTDPKILENTVRLLGFDLTKDVLDLSQESLTKIVTQLPLFPDYCHTEKYKSFIELVMNSVIQVDYLWTQDYINFFTAPQGSLLKDGGTWFKTTHVNLSVALQNFAYLDASTVSTVAERIRALFYNFSPINLTLKDFYLSVEFPSETITGPAADGAVFSFGVTEGTGLQEVTLD